jgi:SAM-dependent methyltransferase
MAQDFKEKNDFKRAHFIQMNLFRPCFKAKSFDLVISNGVLHHTSDPFLAFQTISSLVRPGGYLLVGLYHKYGRIMNDLRRFLFHLTKDKFQFLNAYLRNKSLSEAKRTAWFMDQYKNPHESKHTINEIIRWINNIGFRYINSIPQTIPFTGFSGNEKLFESSRVGNMFERWLVDIGMMFSGRREGGFFIVISQSQK